MTLMDEASSEIDQKHKIALVFFPWQSYAPYKFLSDVLKILDPLCEKIVVIGGNTSRINVTSERVEVRDIHVAVHYVIEKKPTVYSLLLWIVNCILAQIKTSIELVKIHREIDLVLFYMANPFYFVPVITSKLLKKVTIDAVTRSLRRDLRTRIINLQDPILFKLFDGLSPETTAVINELGLTRYQNKLLPESARFIDTAAYKIEKSVTEREKIVGFIGRLVKGKGIEELIKAIPVVRKSDDDVRFLIGGSGALSHYVAEKKQALLDEYDIEIEMPGWIEHGLPEYLNRLKLFVLPTYFDAFPTSILEAMACGAPVLATAKGGITDLIKDGETGFIIEDITPEAIAKSIIRALSCQDLGRIAANARDVIDRKYTYTAAVERWRTILELSGRG